MKHILVIATTFLILAALLASPAYAVTVTVTVKTDKTIYKQGDTLTVSGTISPVTYSAHEYVTIRLFGPAGEIRLSTNLVTVTITGTYSVNVMTFKPEYPLGMWSVEITYMGISSAVTSFIYTRVLTVTTDKSFYGPGNTLNVQGTVSEVTAGQAVAIIVYGPLGDREAIDQTTPEANGTYSKAVMAFAADAPAGVWNTTATYQGVTATTSFSFLPVVGTGTFTPSDPKLLNSDGSPVASVPKGISFYTQLTVTSNVGIDLSTYVLAQIKDSTSRVVALGLTAADVRGGATRAVPVYAFLGIATEGTYTVTMFIWSSITDQGTPLAPTTTFNITIT
jgi:hypothetical protein